MEQPIIISPEDLEPLNQADPQKLSAQLKEREQQPVQRVPFSELGDVEDNAGGFSQLQKELDFKYGGSSGKVAKITLSSSQEKALKIPTPSNELELEKRALNRLTDLQGQGVVRLSGVVQWNGLGLVKEWVNGKVLGSDLLPSWAALENGQQTPLSDEVEAAKLVLSLLDVLDKIHQRKATWGDGQPGDAIWDGQAVTIIDFAQAELATYDADQKQWIVGDPQHYYNFDMAVRADLRGVIGNFFLPYTSILGKPFNEESISQISNQPLQLIAQKVLREDYQSVPQVKADLEKYFLSLGMTEEELGIPLRISSEEIT